MKDTSRNLRIQILIRPQGINQHVGKELQSEDYKHLNELLLDVNTFIEDSVNYIEERYSDDDSD